MTSAALNEADRSHRLDVRLDRLYPVWVIFVMAAILRLGWSFCPGLRGGTGAKGSLRAMTP